MEGVPGDHHLLWNRPILVMDRIPKRRGAHLTMDIRSRVASPEGARNRASRSCGVPFEMVTGD